MARATPTDPDGRLWGVEASFTAAGQTSAAVMARSVTWLALSGTFTGAAVVLDVSFDGGTTFIPYESPLDVPLVKTQAGASLIPCGTESSVLLRLRCVAVATGTIVARLSGGGTPS